MKNSGVFNRICVLGGGLWGTALANHLARKRPVRLWEFFPELAARLERTRRHPHIPGLRLHPRIRVTSDLAEAAHGAQAVLVVLPSTAVRRTARALRPLLEGRPAVVNASKGVERGSLLTLGQVLRQELPRTGGVFALSGPSFAREVAEGIPTKMVLAGPLGAAAEGLQRLLEGGNIRIEASRDPLGVELGGALKNVLAIGCGILDGLKAGSNTKAALMTQGLDEMARLVERLGGRRRTMYGLSGMGDLIATGTSPQSRNRALGEKLGQGKTLGRALKEIPTVAEGAESAASARALLRACGMRAPLLESVWGVVHAGRSPRAVVEALGF